MKARIRHRPRKAGVIAWLRLARVYQKLERAGMEHLRCWGLSVPQFDVLAHVSVAEGLTQQELATARLTTKGNLSQLLDHMERDGLVERRRDGRVKRVYLTERGRRLADEVIPEHETAIAGWMCGLEPEEGEVLLRVLRKLDRALPGLDDAAPG